MPRMSETFCLWETPYKHAVRHAVTDNSSTHSHVGDVRTVYITEDDTYAENVGDILSVGNTV